ncbi:ATP-binding protein [Yersinia enterocolitica]
MKCEPAVYTIALLPEHRGNPLIEALGFKKTDEELWDGMAYYPTCSYEERKLNALVRVDYLSRLDNFRQTLPDYIKCFRAIESALKSGYSAKNPLSPTTMNYLHYPVDGRPNIEPKTGFFKPKGCGVTLIGESGVGKTTLLEQVLGQFPDVIIHSNYQHQPLSLLQVIWLKADCPYDCSVRELCESILTMLDEKLGLEPTMPGRTIPMLFRQIEAKIKSSFLGILVIDEMQNMTARKTRGEDRLLRFIHNLVNNLGVPVLFCGNPPFDDLLSKTLRTARRAENGGYFKMQLLDNDEMWTLFVEELWQLQWTNVVTPVTNQLSSTLYELSAGNIDLAVRIYKEAQRYIIGSNDERITSALLEHAATIASQASAPSMFLIRRAKLRSTQRKKTIIENPTESILSPELSKTSKTVPGDISRPQHPEFSEGLLALIETQDLSHRIVEPDVFQRAAGEENPLKLLQQAGIYCEGPLDTFM